MIRSVAYIPSSELGRMFPNCMSRFDSSGVADDHSFGDNEHSMLRLREVLNGVWEDFSEYQQQDIAAGKSDGDLYREEVFRFWQFMNLIGGDMLVDLET